MASESSKIVEKSEPTRRPFWRWSLSDWAEHCKQSKEIVTLLVLVFSTAAAIVLSFYPTKPKFEIGVRSGRFTLPTMETKKEKLTAATDELTGLRSVDAEFLRNDVRHFTTIEFRNVGQKPFLNVLFQLDTYCKCIVVYVDQNDEAHFQASSKPIKLGSLYSGQSVFLEIWSNQELDVYRRPMVSHDDGSETISIPGSKMSEVESRYMGEAAGAIIVLGIFALGMISAIIGGLFVYDRLFIRKRQAEQGIAAVPSQSTPRIRDRDLGID